MFVLGRVSNAVINKIASAALCSATNWQPLEGADDSNNSILTWMQWKGAMVCNIQWLNVVSFFFPLFFFFYSFKFKQKYNKWQRGIFKAAQCLRGSFTWADTPNQSLASCFPLFPFPVLWYAKLTGCSWCLHSEQIHTRVPSILSSQHQQGSKWALYPKCWTIPLNDFASVESFPKLKKFNSSQKLH